MTLRHGCRPTMRSTGRHSHSFQDFRDPNQNSEATDQWGLFSLLKAVLLDLLGLFKSNYLYNRCNSPAVIKAIFSRFLPPCCVHIPNVYKQIIGLYIKASYRRARRKESGKVYAYKMFYDWTNVILLIVKSKYIQCISRFNWLGLGSH